MCVVDYSNDVMCEYNDVMCEYNDVMCVFVDYSNDVMNSHSSRLLVAAI